MNANGWPNLEILNKHVVTCYNDICRCIVKQQNLISRVTNSQNLKGLIQTTLFKVLYKNYICIGIRHTEYSFLAYYVAFL